MPEATGSGLCHPECTAGGYSGLLVWSCFMKINTCPLMYLMEKKIIPLLDRQSSGVRR